MKLEYNSIMEDSSFVLTDFIGAAAQQLLKNHGLYKILWAREKPCSVLVDGYHVDLQQHQVLFCTTLNVVEMKKNSCVIAIVFNREFYCIRDHDHEVSCNGILFFGSSKPPIITLKEKEIKSYETMLSVFMEEFETADHVQGEMLRVMLKRLLIKSTRLVSKMQGIAELANPQTELIRKFHILVEQNFREKHQVKDYAALLFKSSKTISNIFKKAGYPTPLAIIHERIISEAKRLLLFSDKTAEQISYELGYTEGGHFSKFFKYHCGLPPVEFRNSHLEKTKIS